MMVGGHTQPGGSRLGIAQEMAEDLGPEEGSAGGRLPKVPGKLRMTLVKVGR